jgi:hypothetical protein
VASALVALEGRLRAFGGRQDVVETDETPQAVPAGERALTLAVAEQQSGVREVHGRRHDGRILAYLAGCMRDGQRIGRYLCQDEIAWCAAFASWCAAQACGGLQPHGYRAAVRELWLDALANGAAVAADALRNGSARLHLGDLLIMTRGGNPAGYGRNAFAATQGKGHVGRIRLLDPLTTIDGNVADTITDVRRRLSDAHIVGAIRYPRQEVARVVPGEAELEVARHLWQLQEHMLRGTDTPLANELWDV